MARKPESNNRLVAARNLLRTAKTADEIRMAQAVVLPVDMGFSLDLTAKIIGRSVRVASKMRTNFLRSENIDCLAPRRKQTLRNRAHTTLEREAEILAEVFQGGQWDGSAAQALKHKVEEKLGKNIALSTLYRMLARNGWKKICPRTTSQRKKGRTEEAGMEKAVWRKF